MSWLRPAARSSLSRTFALLAACLIFVIAMSMSLLAVSTQTRANEREMRDMWQLTGEVVGSTIANSLAMGDLEFVENFARRFAESDSDVRYFAIFDTSSMCQFDSRSGILMEPREDPLVAQCVATGDQIFVLDDDESSLMRTAKLAIPIRTRDELVGVGRIDINAAHLDAMAISLYERFALIGLGCVFVAMLAAWVFARHLSRPLVALSEAARQVASGDLAVRTDTNRRDELGELARSFDGMISNLRTAQDEIESARYYVENIVESMVDALLVIEPAAPQLGWSGEVLIRTVNRAALDMLGYAEHVILGLPLGRILPQSGLRDALVGAISEGAAVRDFETSLVAGDGKMIPVRVTASIMSRVAYPDAQCPQHGAEECDCTRGVVEACVLVATDISELRRAEQIRTATYEVIDAGQTGGGQRTLYATLDRALGQLMPVDSLLIALHDEKAGELKFPYYRSRSQLGIAPSPAEGEQGLTAYARKRGGAVHLTRFEIFRLVEEGAVVLDGPAPAQWAGVPLVVGNLPIGLLAVQCDGEGAAYSPDDLDILAFFGDQVSTALQRQHATEDRARLSSAVEHAEDAIVITDADGGIEYVNPAFERLTGYDREEVIGQTTTMLRDPEADEDKYDEMWKTVAGGEAWTGRVSYRRKDGSAYQADVAMSPVRDDAGEIANYVAVQHDVTHEVALEEQLRHSQKMDAVGKLAGGVAHDFNNLLSVITGYSSMLSDSLGPDSEERDFVDEVAKAAERASRLTRQLLAFSRRQVLKPIALDLNDVVNDMEKMLRRLIGEDIDFATSLKPTIGEVEADPGQIEQVLMNLAVNARDAMPHGGRLTLATTTTVLDADYCARNPDVLPGKYVLLSMSDTGCGMDAATMSRIFEPFFTTKGLGEGTGLGLSTVYGIVKQSGGHVSVYSEVDGGATFRVYLPMVEDCGMDATQAIPQPTSRGSETILLVEDEDGVRKLAELILQRRGYTVIAACHGPDALEKSAAFEGEIPLLLTDVVMPHMSGRDVYELLSAVRPGLKVLYMSGYTDSAIVHHGVLEAGTPFMEKPFIPEQLARNVRDVLDMDTLAPLAG